MKTRMILTVAVALSTVCPRTPAEEIVDTWRYTESKPAEGWQLPEFDDSAWKEGDGGFGTRRTPGARIGTEWKGRDLWLRKSFPLSTVPQKPALLIHHDDNAEVFLNGKPAASFSRWTSEYIVAPLSADAAALLKPGANHLAVYCHQDAGGQFIDVHVIDADSVPKLPRPKRSQTPFKSRLITRWGSEVTAENAWTEYPRPQLVRSDWQNLNGHWDFAVTPASAAAAPSTWDAKILVPFCLESRLGGVQRLLDAEEALWYRRTFTHHPHDGHRTLLNFEAVDYECSVFVNGMKIGEHRGGNNPFSLDATDAIRKGDNELIVRVEDDTEAWQLHGKQRLDPGGIWYTQVSGIWQTVWLEQVPSQWIADLDLTTDAATGQLTVQAEVAGTGAGTRLRVLVRDGDTEVVQGTGDNFLVSVIVPQARLWTPETPHLYSLSVSLVDAAGTVIVDQIQSYVGIRSVGKQRDENGHLRFTLNGTTIFPLGPLDQGWWPDGLLTPPSDEAMVFDVEFLKSAGFNMIRKHIKIEPRRYYYHCDRLGMMVWQDQVSGSHNPPWTRMQPNPKDAEWPAEAHAQYLLEFDRMIDSLDGHACIVMWIPFNEAWGQHQTLEVGKWAVERDRSRLINIASGGNFWPVGDVADHHEYPHPNFPFDAERYRDFIHVVGEYGGHGFPIRGHLWEETDAVWGYGNLPKTPEELRDRYRISTERLAELRTKGIAAGVYTQTTDVEIEVNGLMTYDREIIKIPADVLRDYHTLVTGK